MPYGFTEACKARMILEDDVGSDPLPSESVGQRPMYIHKLNVVKASSNMQQHSYELVRDSP